MTDIRPPTGAEHDDEWMTTIDDESTRRVLLAIVDKVFPEVSDGQCCNRCGHGSSEHRLNDALDVSPTSPLAQFRCTRGVASYRLCDCPDYVEYSLRRTSVRENWRRRSARWARSLIRATHV